MLSKLRRKLVQTVQNRRFLRFEDEIFNETWMRHDEILAWSESLVEQESNLLARSNTSEPSDIIAKGVELRNRVLCEFENKYISTGIRLLIHLPSKSSSPGGYSLFSNLAESMRFVGIPTETLIVGEDIRPTLANFKPTVFISSDSESYLKTIDWSALQNYKKSANLKIGLTASLQEYGNSALIPRLKWGIKNGVDFYYSFRSPEYLQSREQYKSFYEFGYKILSVEFGANPLLYYPIHVVEKDLNYIFLASSNSDKQARYFQWLPSILTNYFGFIDGPGWRKNSRWAAQPAHKYLYARARVGINLHIDDSINWASELNERTYILAACGVPQLMDDPLLLSHRFSSEAFFCAKSPGEYLELFEFIRNNPGVAKDRAMTALVEVFDRHTTLHRAEYFIRQLKEFNGRL